MVKAQGGNENWVYDISLFPKAKFEKEIKATNSGVLSKMNTEKIGISSAMLKAGRAFKEDVIDFSAGIKVFAKTGDLIQKGDVIAVMYANDSSLFSEAENEYISAIIID